MEKTRSFDVAIIGGGPAGSAMGCYLARAGVSCIILEREAFPRPHVGESLVPSSTRVFAELGFLEKMEANGFPHKYGAVWTAPTSAKTASHDWEGLHPSESADIAFAEREQEGVFQPYTYHVDRGKFDQLLLEHAAELGAEVLTQATVRDVHFISNGEVVLNAATGDGPLEIKARMVVDASGRRTFLGNRLGLKVMDPVFDQYAVHTWFEDYDRGGAEFKDYIHVHFLPLSNTWIWQIPITDRITSIGLVTQKENFKGSAMDRVDFFWESVRSRPELHERLQSARQINEFKTEGDYSYAMQEIAGDGYILIGDAARFVDPIFSSGVSVALNSARFACPNILAALEAGDFRAARFSSYTETIKRGVRTWYEFISLYYRLNLVFTAFVNHPEYRYDILKLLQGDVYDAEHPEVLRKMRTMIRAVEADPNHLWHNLLGTLNADVLKSAY